MDESIDEWELRCVCTYDNYTSVGLVKALRGERITEFDMTEEEWKEFVLNYKEPIK